MDAWRAMRCGAGGPARTGWSAARCGLAGRPRATHLTRHLAVRADLAHAVTYQIFDAHTHGDASVERPGRWPGGVYDCSRRDLLRRNDVRNAVVESADIQNDVDRQGFVG